MVCKIRRWLVCAALAARWRSPGEGRAVGPSPRAPWLPSMAAGVREVPDLPGARGVRTLPDAEARPESDAGPVLLGRVGRGGAPPHGHQQKKGRARRRKKGRVRRKQGSGVKEERGAK